MTYKILVEPAPQHRRGFARWCLAQDPPIMTASSHGSEVPSDLFQSVPDELLDGALVDGHVFRPVIDGKQPEGDGYKPEPEPEAVVKTPVRRSRKRPAAQEGTAE